MNVSQIKDDEMNEKPLALVFPETCVADHDTDSSDGWLILPVALLRLFTECTYSVYR